MFALTARIKLDTGQTFCHDFIFATQDERLEMQRWLAANPDKGSWICCNPFSLATPQSAKAYVTYFADMRVSS